MKIADGELRGEGRRRRLALHLFICIFQFGFCSAVLAGETWPQFRGPTGQGHSDSTGLPTHWNETQNVAWKTRIHGLGWSTPVVWGQQVWVTTATEDGGDMFAVCLDRETGSIVHDLHLFHNETVEPLGNDVNCYASPSPVIEEGRLYVHFGSYGTACVDTRTGKVLWQRRDLPCRHYRGPGSSVILFEDKLILTMDGVDVQYLAALDKQTGRTLWKTDRTTRWTDWGADGNPIAEGDYRKAYSTPIIAMVEGEPVMVAPGAKAAFAYDPRNGRELWHITYDGFSNAAASLYGHGLFFINGAHRSGLYAVRPGGSGDVTDSHVIWKYPKNILYKPSPVLVDELIYMVDDGGVATCLEAATGQEVWKERMGGKFSASPVYADGRIYFLSEDGTATVLEPGRQYKVLAQNKLDDGFMASPAVAGRALFLRTRTHLYRIEAADQ